MIITQDILNESEKYTAGEYTFNEVMSRVSNSTTIKQLVHYEEYFNNNLSKYPSHQVEFAAEFIESKFQAMEDKIVLEMLEGI